MKCENYNETARGGKVRMRVAKRVTDRQSAHTRRRWGVSDVILHRKGT